MVFTYAIMFTFIVCILVKNPSFLSLNSSHFSSLISHFFPISSSSSLDSLSNRTQTEALPQIMGLKSKNSGNYAESQWKLYESMMHCDIFDGKWVRDDSYPLYEPGSCPLIDEGFNCFLNGRPDNDYERFRWQLNHCTIPRGGEWNSGGKCDKETEPFKNETYLLSYPPKMQILENVMKGMRTPVSCLNISRLTDYRKDAYPAIYGAQHLSDEERRLPLRYQDCSHWCLPGVPDTWNDLVYAQMLIRHYQTQDQEGKGERT